VAEVMVAGEVNRHRILSPVPPGLKPPGTTAVVRRSEDGFRPPPNQRRILARRPDGSRRRRDKKPEAIMSIVLDHTIVPARDNAASAKFFARVFGLRFDGPVSHFAPVRVNDTLVLDFDTRATFDWHHYAFKVGDAEFDAIFQRVTDEGIAYGSGPRSADDMRINHRAGGRGFYFKDPNGHLLEVLTA
jgi:catechol 2,3-dioxygenase-like lactoylglutathione lyase family enzyme